MVKIAVRTLAALCLGLLLLNLLGCADDHKLLSIDVSPQTSTITGAGLNLQFTATGHYVHPLENKDITSTVVWASSADQIISFATPSQPGLATSGSGCGTNLQISASVYSNPKTPANGSVISGVATVSVQQPGGVCQ
ncbi:MAG TPA: hypothetical protein VN658_04625 [Candidatus Acidoferrales bacterium]|nr:hypothetical protein [Candidatus Acidoferrales bacterium]